MKNRLPQKRIIELNIIAYKFPLDLTKERSHNRYAQMQTSRGLHVFSGGATGSDSEWVRAFTRNGLASKVTIWSFTGHDIDYKPSEDIISALHIRLLSESEKTDADVALEKARVGLGRWLPRGEFVRNLLRRNYCIARDADCMLAIGRLTTQVRGGSVRIDGGTGWACQLFANKFVVESRAVKVPEVNDGLHDIPLFVCDKGVWHRCAVNLANNFVWTMCSSDAVILHLAQSNAKCALIGSREMTPIDKTAIEAVAEALLDKREY